MKSSNQSRLVDADGLLDVLFARSARPSLRWVRYHQKTRSIPFVRIGRLVFFDPVEVREALEHHNTIRPRA